VLLIGAVPVAAFSIGHLASSRLADEVLPTIDTAGEYELHVGIPEAEDSLAVIEEQQRLVRTRVASERTAVLVQRAALGTASLAERSALRQEIQQSQGLLDSLQDDTAALVISRSEAQGRLDRLKRTAAERRSAALANDGRLRDALAVGAAVAIALGLLGAILLCTRGGRLLVDVRSVTIGSTSLLVIFAAASFIGWVAAALILALGAVLIAWQPKS
jgi:hypothetical protein